jgi:hypothetical protein
LVFENIKTDAAVGVDVRVIDSCCEVDLGRLHSVHERERDENTTHHHLNGIGCAQVSDAATPMSNVQRKQSTHVHVRDVRQREEHTHTYAQASQTHTHTHRHTQTLNG